MFGGRGARRARARNFEAEDIGSAIRGQDVTATATITLNEAAHGGTRRLELPIGKEIEFKIPPGIADGKQIRLQGPGHAGAARRPAGRRADHGVDRAASAVQGRRAEPAARTADHALRSGARRQGARADARRRGRACDPGRTRRAGARSASRARACRARTARAISTSRRGSCCPTARMPSSKS